MKNLTRNRYSLILVIATLLLLGVGTSSALAGCPGWEEGPGTDWYYLDANYGGWQSTAPLVIKINGDATDLQTFNVGDTVTISSHLRAVTASCSGGHNESYSIADLDVSGPSGSDSATTGDIFDFSDTGCSGTDHEETLAITYPLTDLGTHTVFMNSNAQIDQYFGGLSLSQDCTAQLSFEVVQPFTSVGDCISTLIDTECGGLKGRGRSACVKEQIGYCHALFAVPSALNQD